MFYALINGSKDEFDFDTQLLNALFWHHRWGSVFYALTDSSNMNDCFILTLLVGQYVLCQSCAELLKLLWQEGFKPIFLGHFCTSCSTDGVKNYIGYSFSDDKDMMAS